MLEKSVTPAVVVIAGQLTLFELDAYATAGARPGQPRDARTVGHEVRRVSSWPRFPRDAEWGELMLSVWSEWLVGSWGPVANLARTADSPPIADLSIVRDGADGNELVVTGVINGDDPAFAEAICAWAASLGYTPGVADRRRGRARSRDSRDSRSSPRGRGGLLPQLRSDLV